VLVVVRRDVAAAANDALGAPPDAWGSEADQASFDRALSNAAWTLTGPVGRSGSTAADGRFDVAGLPPGPYELSLTRTLNGNLVDVRVPIHVGSDGAAEILVEISPGSVRVSVTYGEGETLVEEITGPNGTTLVTRDGKPSEIAGPSGEIVDPDGDGIFEPAGCGDALWLCEDRATCGPDRQCVCTSSCPFCEDCGPLVCAPAGVNGVYRCGEGGTCQNPGERCACVSSGPNLDDCVESVCVPSCDPVGIVGLDVTGPAEVRVGRQAQLFAVAELDNGGRIDVTHQVEWQSSDESVLSVDSWGVALGLATGTATVTAGLVAGTVSLADEITIRVAERPTLRALYIQNYSCYPILGGPLAEGSETGAPRPPVDGLPGDFLPPFCLQVVRVGATLQFSAIGELADGSYEDLTGEVEWRVSEPSVGSIERGLFTALAEGTTGVSAALGDVESEPSEVRVVTEPTIVQLTIYPEYGGVVPFGGVIDVAEPGAAPDFCLDCRAAVPVLLGDELRFHASAVYDTGEWEDVTDRVTWRTSDPAVATIGADGVMTAVGAGEADIDATLDEVTSEPVTVSVVAEATLLGLSIYQEGLDRVVAKGGEALFRAHGFYDVGFGRDLTADVVWRSSDESVGGFPEPGVFVGRAAGNVEVWAELDGVESERLPMEVFEESAIEYCDPEHPNRGVWTDGFNRVVLESDCAEYMPPEVATLRFTVTERERPGGIFDPCLDLYVFQGSQLVRTIREEGCGVPFLAPGAEFDAAAPRYQNRAFWDLKDDRGNLVPPGVYTIHGRFFLYYDPVVSISVAVVSPTGRIPCQQNDCGNGCGYVHRCGDTDPPEACPAVCVPLCECPFGWGITAEGDCEPCDEECCLEGTECDPDIPPCGPPQGCCPEGEICLGVLPPCEPECCPLGQECNPTLLPCQTRCCPAGADCGPANLPPCEDKCCPPDLACIPELQPCPSDTSP
jgi:hypothetical protein